MSRSLRPGSYLCWTASCAAGWWGGSANWPKLPVVLISHGDEMFALRSEYQLVYPEIHKMARRLVEEQELLFNVCEAWASNEGVVWTEFPRFVDVVPFAPAEIENYRALEYRIVSVEQTW
jgi:hypothetical protein